MTRVAIVEDNPTVRNYLSDLISGTAGYRCVCTCGSAEEAVIKIPETHPNVVLMDVHLPGETGIACTAFLRDKMPEVQVIMLTVYKDIETIFEALKAGACGYVLKRSNEQEILEAIAEVRAGGAPMTSQVARMVVRSFAQVSPETAGTNRLSPRESEILALVAKGLSNKEVANTLGISIGTVRIHLNHIYEKLHVRCRTEAAAKYLLSKPHSLIPRNRESA
ncbi:MAG TPA: response regulator transcription factor [Candidatus Paceibacterota bacterium]|nr:response regulator transcription factor [Candidatus Paceibacterota bacterium]